MKRLDVIEQVLSCTNCALHAQCTAPVPMRGEPGLLAIVGEAPGETEDREGRPFIGPAGKLLQSVLDEFNFPPAGIVNSVSCFPHGAPDWEQLKACEGNKWAQLDYLSPTYILLLGRVALKGMRSDLELKRGRARPFRIRERICFATYHPAAALRNGTYEQGMRADLETFRELIAAEGDGWLDYIPQSCSACPNPAEWYEEDTGLGWCPIHLPSTEKGKHSDRQALIAAELDAARRNEATRVTAVTEGASTEWLAHAWDTLIGYLRTHDEYVTADFWNETGLTRPPEPRALGSLLQKAERQGLIEKTGDARDGKPVWRSLLRVTTP